MESVTSSTTATSTAPPLQASQRHNGQSTDYPSSFTSSRHNTNTNIKESATSSHDQADNTKRKRRRERVNSNASSEGKSIPTIPPEFTSSSVQHALSTNRLTIEKSTEKSAIVSSTDHPHSTTLVSTSINTSTTVPNNDNKALFVTTSNTSTATATTTTTTPSSSSATTRTTTVRNNDKKESPTSTTQNPETTTTNEKTADEEKRFGTIPDTLPSKKNKIVEKTHPTQQHNQTDKAPNKSSLRKTSSTRSALSLVFDISQNQTISRSTSAASSRCESRQGRYHVECQPVEDPSLKVENWNRARGVRSPRIRSSSSSRAGSEPSLLGRRESVTNLIFAGQSHIDSEDGGLEAAYWKKLQLQYTPRGSLQFDKMATSPKGNDITPGDFNVRVDEDYSLSRQSKVNTPMSSASGRYSSPPRCRSGFLYQVTDFDRLSKDVPAFVRHYAQKSGKMITESFILRLNYLRRRRQLGESSTTINIGNNSNNNNNNNNNNAGHGHSHNSTAGNLNNVGKRTSPTAAG